jgi:hypothetical protein
MYVAELTGVKDGGNYGYISGLGIQKVTLP